MNDNQSATGHLRNQAGTMTIIGLVLCFTPLLPLGLLWSVASALVWLCTPAVQVAEDAARQNTRAQVAEGTGHGCGGVVAVCLLVTVIVLIAIGAGLGAVGGLNK